MTKGEVLAQAESARQQRHPRCHQTLRNPPLPVHSLMQRDFRGDGVADEG